MLLLPRTSCACTLTPLSSRSAWSSAWRCRGDIGRYRGDTVQRVELRLVTRVRLRVRLRLRGGDRVLGFGPTPSRIYLHRARARRVVDDHEAHRARVLDLLAHVPHRLHDDGLLVGQVARHDERHLGVGVGVGSGSGSGFELVTVRVRVRVTGLGVGSGLPRASARAAWR